MAKDIKFFASDVRQHAAEVKKTFDDVPRIMAGAAIKMKDANFSAQGFIENGSVVQPWPQRKKETIRTSGKRVLHATGTLQKSVKARFGAKQVRVGVDLSKVPYAQVHNEGGKAGRNGSAQMPERKFLGYTPDIEVILDREMTDKLNRIFSK